MSTSDKWKQMAPVTNIASGIKKGRCCFASRKKVVAEQVQPRVIVLPCQCSLSAGRLRTAVPIRFSKVAPQSCVRWAPRWHHWSGVNPLFASFQPPCSWGVTLGAKAVRFTCGVGREGCSWACCVVHFWCGTTKSARFLASVVAGPPGPWRPRVTFGVEWIKFSISVCKKLNHQLARKVNDATISCTFVLACFHMVFDETFLALCCELVKLSACCVLFFTWQGPTKKHMLAPLQIPSFESFKKSNGCCCSLTKILFDSRKLFPVLEHKTTLLNNLNWRRLVETLHWFREESKTVLQIDCILSCQIDWIQRRVSNASLNQRRVSSLQWTEEEIEKVFSKSEKGCQAQITCEQCSQILNANFHLVHTSIKAWTLGTSSAASPSGWLRALARPSLCSCGRACLLLASWTSVKQDDNDKQWQNRESMSSCSAFLGVDKWHHLLSFVEFDGITTMTWWCRSRSTSLGGTRDQEEMRQFVRVFFQPSSSLHCLSRAHCQLLADLWQRLIAFHQQGAQRAITLKRWACPCWTGG